MFQGSQHMRYMLDTTTLKIAVDNAVSFLSSYPKEYDSLAFTGLSGAVLAPAIALAVGKQLIAVRKPDDTNNHAGQRVEGNVDTKAYIIIDDLQASGTTARRVKAGIKKWAPKAKCLGVLELIDYGGYPRSSVNKLNRVMPGEKEEEFHD